MFGQLRHRVRRRDRECTRRIATRTSTSRRTTWRICPPSGSFAPQLFVARTTTTRTRTTTQARWIRRRDVAHVRRTPSRGPSVERRLVGRRRQVLQAREGALRCCREGGGRSRDHAAIHPHVPAALPLDRSRRHAFMPQSFISQESDDSDDNGRSCLLLQRPRLLRLGARSSASWAAACWRTRRRPRKYHVARVLPLLYSVMSVMHRESVRVVRQRQQRRWRATWTTRRSSTW